MSTIIQLPISNTSLTLKSDLWSALLQQLLDPRALSVSQAANLMQGWLAEAIHPALSGAILIAFKVMGIQQRIVDSVIGQRAQLKVAPQRPKALRFLIGDDSQLELV